MIKFVDKYILKVLMTVFHMLEILEERLNLLNRDKEVIFFKRCKLNSRDENYNVWEEKYTRWD